MLLGFLEQFREHVPGHVIVGRLAHADGAPEMGQPAASSPD